MNAATIAGLPDSITLAERRVLALAGTSTLGNKELADALHVSVSTVRNHLSKIYHKMGWQGGRGRVKLLQWCVSRENGNHAGKP